MLLADRRCGDGDLPADLLPALHPRGRRRRPDLALRLRRRIRPVSPSFGSCSAATPPFVLAEHDNAIVRDPRRHRVEVFRLPHDALHRRPAADRPEPLRGRAIDGATDWQRFRSDHAAAPRRRRSASRCSSRILGSIQLFDLIMPLTKGGPLDSTQTMVTYLYIYGVTRMRIGFGSAVGVVLFVICVVVRLRLQAGSHAP